MLPRRALAAPGSAVLGFQVGGGRELHYGGRAGSGELHHQPARMEGVEGGAMADAEQRRLGETLAQQSIETRLRGLVDRRGRFVEEESLGLLHERPREGDALLLAGREPQRPVSGLVEVQTLLHGIPGIEFCYFSEVDVVRHPLVAAIIRAYERDSSREET